MKNCVLFILLLCIGFTNSHAQKTGSVIGTINHQQQPVEYATVTLRMLTDSSAIQAYGISDSLGKFTFIKLPIGGYILKITLIGFQPLDQKVFISTEKNTITIDNIELTTDKSSLTSLTVTSQTKLIQKTSEGFIVNAAANITQIGGTATDLLRSTPTISVDGDGAITLRGKTPMFLINGRNSAFSSIDQIPASSIETIEIITNASAKYDANAQSGIINIKLKKNKANGTTGAVSIGAGLGSGGRTANSLVLNHKTKKWNLGIGYDNRFARRTKHITNNRINFYLPDSTTINQDRNDERVESLQNVKFNIDYTPNNKNSFSFEGLLNVEGQDNDETLQSIIYKQNKSFTSSNSRHSIEIRKAKLAEFATVFQHKFLDPKKSFSASLTTSLSDSKENTDISTQYFKEDNSNLGNPFLQKTYTYENGNISNAMIDYSFPVFEKGILETGYKGTFRSIKTDYASSDKVGNDYIINTGFTNIFKFNEQINAAYALFHSYFGKTENPNWKYDMGLRLEQVNNQGETQNKSTNFSNAYLKLFPTVTVSYLLATNQLFKLSYAKRINRPSLGDLNPFVDITDALSPHSGNPNLKPEIINAFELGYNNEWKNMSISSSAFYRHAENTIRSFLQLQPDGTVLRIPSNIGTENSYGLENIINATPSEFYNVNLSFTLFQLYQNANNISADAVQESFNWYGKMINNFSISKRGKLQIIGSYNSDINTPQGNLTSIYNIDLGFQQKLGKGNARIGLNIVDAFNTLQSGSNTYTSNFNSFKTQKADTRAIMLTFAYSFKSTFKEKLMDNKFSKEF